MAIYNGKHCVFEQVGVDSDQALFNAFTNKDSDNCYNNWDISGMRNTTLPAVLLKLSTVLQDNLTDTTIQTAKNGLSSTLVSTSDKLFIAAEKEITGTRQWGRAEEFSALTTWLYRTTHTTDSDRVKLDPSNLAQTYWLRSPCTGSGSDVVLVYGNGSFDARIARNTYCVSLCYAF